MQSQVDLDSTAPSNPIYSFVESPAAYFAFLSPSYPTPYLMILLLQFPHPAAVYVLAKYDIAHYPRLKVVI
jgi:hypothetical protein